MSLSEIFNKGNSFADQVKGGAANVSHKAFKLEDVAENGTVTAQGERTRDPILSGLARRTQDISGKFYVTARGAQKEIITPARALSEALGEVQDNYKKYKRNPITAHEKGLGRSVQVLQTMTYHFGVDKPRIAGISAAENISTLLELAMKSVDAELIVERDKEYKASLGSEAEVVTATDIRSGELVTINGQSVVLNSRQSEKPTIKHRLLSLLKF